MCISDPKSVCLVPGQTGGKLRGAVEIFYRPLWVLVRRYLRLWIVSPGWYPSKRSEGEHFQNLTQQPRVCIGKLSQIHPSPLLPPQLSSCKTPPSPPPHYPCLTLVIFAGWLVAPYRPSVQPLQPLALHQHHQHPQPTLPTQLPGPIPSLPVPDSTTSTTYSNNKMASLDLSPTDSPNVTLTIRLIMQGKVSTSPPPYPTSPLPQNRVKWHPWFPVFEQNPGPSNSWIYSEKEEERCRGKSLLSQNAICPQLSLSS